MRTPILCRNSGGLSNRINSLASAIAVPDRRVALHWPRNRACPVKFEDIFDPIDGVDVTELSHGDFPPCHSTVEISWPKAINATHLSRWTFEGRILHAYYLIHASLEERCPEANPEPYDEPVLGFHFRQYGAHAGVYPDFERFLGRSLALVEHYRGLDLDVPRMFLATDCETRGARFRDAMESAGCRIESNVVRGLQYDEDRNAEQVRGFIKDLLTLAQCRAVVFNNPISTVVDSLDACGVRTYCVRDLATQRVPGPMEVSHHLPLEMLFEHLTQQAQ